MINRQELLAILVSAEKHLQKWLDLDLCECEGGHSCGRDKVEANVAEMSDAITSLQAAESETGFSDYDPGLINDFGGGNVAWWQDYIRCEVERTNDFWRDQLEPLLTRLALPAPDVSGLVEALTPLPCPFCGSTDVGGAGGKVNCYKCNAQIAVQNANTHYATQLWNRRVSAFFVPRKLK